MLTVILVLLIVGIVLGLVNAYIPMDGRIKTILNVVVVVLTVLYVLAAFGLVGDLHWR